MAVTILALTGGSALAEFLSNDDESLAASLERWVARSKRASWAVAYIRRSFVDRLSPALNAFERSGGKLRIVTGSGQHFTEAEALELLQSATGVEIRVYHADRVTFHPKLYLFENGDQAAIVGSANMSAGAISNNVEVAAEISSATDAEFVQRAREWFEAVWERSIPLTPALIAWFKSQERDESDEEFGRLFREQRAAYETGASGDEYAREPLFSLGTVYTNQELSRIAEVSTQAGIRYRGSVATTIRRCIAITRMDSDAPYADGWTGDGRLRYTGEGLYGDQALARGNRVLELQRTTGFPLHVFERQRKDQYRYLGQFRVLGFHTETQLDADGNQRTVFMFELEPIF